MGAEYRCGQVLQPTGSGRPHEVKTSSGESISAGQFVFACGPWLWKVFSDVLWVRIFPSRPEVFFFGIPPGDMGVSPPALPTWLFSEDLVFWIADLAGPWVK